jgi:16S rRNA (uracil1498-N3)-methyltransferase
MSSTPRIFSPIAKVKWPNCPLDEFSLHHLKDVLRLRKGNLVEVVAGDTLWTVKLVEFQPKANLMTTEPVSSVKIPVAPLDIHLIQCVPKVDKISEIIRSCTEMGVARITPVISERCVSVPTEKAAAKHARWEQVVMSAAAQSRQIRVPVMDRLTNYSAAIFEPTSAKKIIFWEDATVSLRTALSTMGLNASPHPISLRIVIGPEGGLSEPEVKVARELGYVEASLGPTILRVEHAGLVAIAQLAYALL